MKKEVVPVVQRVYDKDKYRDLLRKPFAHRGVHMTEDCPENSMPAFEKAVEMGLGIELDIHLSRDEQLVVFHDDNLRRMTGANEYIKYLTYEQIQAYSLANTDCKIPLLSQVLDMVKGRVPVLIEIKSNNNMKKLVPKLKQLLDTYKGVVFIQSFDPFALRKCYKQIPNIIRGQLASFFTNKEFKLSWYKKAIIKRLILKSFSHIDFVSYDVRHLPNRYVSKFNVPVLAWTIRTEDEYKIGKQNANNLIVDNVDLLK